MWLFILSGDSLTWHKNQKFSTNDADHDSDIYRHCAVVYGGAWWYKDCIRSALTQRYYPKYQSSPNSRGVTWYGWKGSDTSYKTATMMVRPDGFLPPGEIFNDISTTKIDEFACPTNISETVAVRTLKLAHRPRIASITIKLISKPSVLSNWLTLLKNNSANHN